MDSGAWRAAVHKVAQSRTQVKRLSMRACIGEGNGNPLQCSCLENPGDGGAWWAAVYGVAQSRTRLKRLSSSSSSEKLQPPFQGRWSQQHPPLSRLPSSQWGPLQERWAQCVFQGWGRDEQVPSPEGSSCRIHLSVIYSPGPPANNLAPPVTSSSDF